MVATPPPRPLRVHPSKGGDFGREHHKTILHSSFFILHSSFFIRAEGAEARGIVAEPPKGKPRGAPLVRLRRDRR
jgi:hypothetical protein